MATINISDLRPTGSELFSDSESYMNELSEGELVEVSGRGSGWFCQAVVATAIGATSPASVSVSVFVATFGAFEGEAY